MDNHGEMLIYQTEDGLTKIDVNMQDETVWLTQQQMADLFQTSRTNVVEHIKHIYDEDELDENSTCRKFRQVRKEGNREVAREMPFYNLDMIISLGYRVKSSIATNFRRWATERLKEYMIKGFTMDDDRLKELGGGGYFKELLERIRDIRASEKVFYRQVLEIYATSVDYNPTAEVSVQFFKRVQNKIHYAVSGETAAEVIYHRADAEKDFMGLMTFSGDQPTLREAKVAKNYLDEKELRVMGQLVSGYLDFAERQAERQVPMTMEDWAKHLDGILTSTGENLLTGNGAVCHLQAMEKAQTEYKKYKAKTLSSVEQDYLASIKLLEKKGKKK
ncbi:MAG: virulence RhuM family protein [Ruminococcus sp.]|nr:virulence RhuM family protein [Ruminococcus sp.]